MQPWDQVTAINGDFEGQAGVIQSVDGDHAIVKFDLRDTTSLVALVDLRLLGR